MSGIGFDIDDEWLGAIMLAGLTDEYKPLIMSLEGSGIKHTADSIKQKLLDTTEEEGTSGEVFFVKKKPVFKYKSKNFTCYNCGGPNHKSADCKQRIQSQSESSSQNSPANVVSNSNNPVGKARVARRTAFKATFIAKNGNNKNDWYIGSAASSNMTPYGDIVNNKVQSHVKQQLMIPK